MTDRNVEEKVAAYVQQTTPDVLDSILRRCDEQEGKVLTMTDIQKSNNN